MTAITAILAKIPLWAWILAAALIVIGWQRIEVIHYKHQTLALQTVANSLHTANQSNLDTIADLQHANGAWADKCVADTARAVKAAHDATQYAQTQHEAAIAAQQALNHAYATEPKAKAWSLAVVPPDVVRVLARSSGQDKDGPGQSAGVRDDPR